MSSASIPNRPAFRAQEVCEIASVQPYVLRGWEAEFPDLGVAKAAGGPRVYRRVDVERVLRLKHLIQVEGLTLAGARRRLEEQNEPDLLLEVAEAELEAAAPPVSKLSSVGTVSALSSDAKAHLQEARQGLQWILQTLNGSGDGPGEFALAASSAKARRSRKVVK